MFFRLVLRTGTNHFTATLVAGWYGTDWLCLIPLSFRNSTRLSEVNCGLIVADELLIGSIQIPQDGDGLVCGGAVHGNGLWPF